MTAIGSLEAQWLYHQAGVQAERAQGRFHFLQNVEANERIKQAVNTTQVGSCLGRPAKNILLHFGS